MYSILLWVSNIAFLMNMCRSGLVISKTLLIYSGPNIVISFVDRNDINQ